jgi:DNA-binding transcriptional ArsR family regulator
MKETIVVLRVRDDRDDRSWWKALDLPEPWRWTDESFEPDVFAAVVIDQEVLPPQPWPVEPARAAARDRVVPDRDAILAALRRRLASGWQTAAKLAEELRGDGFDLYDGRAIGVHLIQLEEAGSAERRGKTDDHGRWHGTEWRATDSA